MHKHYRDSSRGILSVSPLAPNKCLEELISDSSCLKEREESHCCDSRRHNEGPIRAGSRRR